MAESKTGFELTAQAYLELLKTTDRNALATNHLQERVDKLERRVDGNGAPGIHRTVDRHDQQISECLRSLAWLKKLGTVLLTALILAAAGLIWQAVLRTQVERRQGLPGPPPPPAYSQPQDTPTPPAPVRRDRDGR